MRARLLATVVAVMFAVPVLAQPQTPDPNQPPGQPPGQPQATNPSPPPAQPQVTDPKKEELTRDPQVQGAQQPEPGPQGIRSPEPLPTQTVPVAQALDKVERTPLNVAGQPVPRPNGLSNLPEKIAPPQ